MKKLLSVLCVLCLLVGCLSIAAAEQPVNLRISWWGGESRHAATVAALDVFMGKYPEYTAEGEYGASSYNDKIATQLTGNQAPDVMQLSYANIIGFAENGWVLPIDSYIEEGIIDTSKLDQSIIDMYKVDGVTYALPTGINTTVLLYNKDIFDEAGIAYPDGTWTFDEYYEVARQLKADTDGDGQIDRWGCSNPFTDKVEITFLRMYYAKGGHLWNDTFDACDVDLDIGAQILQEMVDLVKEGLFPDIELTASNPSGVYDFTLGRTAMCLLEASGVASREALADFRMGVCRAPECAEMPLYWLSPSQLWVISKDTVDPVGAAKLMNFMVNDMDGGAVLGIQRGIPANSDIRAMVASAEGTSEAVKESYVAVDDTSAHTGDVIPEMYPANGMSFFDEMGKQFDLLIYGMTTPEEAIKACVEYTDRMMSD